ncbi:MAG: MinD/ParA family protein [Candidatus Nitrospinota bacterium M3_3B_026]
MARGFEKRGAGAEGPGKARGIAVASGKGGVGKTNVVANLAYAFASMGKRTLVFDADIGLGNIHILLGLAPRYNLDHVASGEKTMDEIIVKGPGGVEILPASSGARRRSELSGEEMLALRTELEALEREYDFILFDVGAGVSSNVMYFCSAAGELVVVTSTEPTAFADAYAIMKKLSREYDRRDFRLIVNSVKNAAEAQSVSERLARVADRFGLDIRIDLLGHITQDEMVSRAVREQRLFMEKYPGTKAAGLLKRIAKNLVENDAPAGIGWEKVLAS